MKKKILLFIAGLASFGISLAGASAPAVEAVL